MELIAAAKRNDLAEVCILLRNEKYPSNSVDDREWSALHYASCQGNKAIVQALLSHQTTRVDLETESGYKPIHLAAENGHEAIVLLLIDQKLKNQEDAEKEKMESLLLAAEAGHANVVALLIDRKVSLESTSKNKWTALHFAADSGHTDIASLLIKHQCSLQAVTEEGCTAIHVASQHGHTATLAELLKHTDKDAIDVATQKGETALHLAAHNGYIATVTLLIQAQASVNSTTEVGETALHLAAKQGHIKVVNHLIENKASVNDVINDGWSALHVATRNGHSGIVNLLISKKCALDAVTQEGLTALHLASEFGYTDIANLLLSHACNVNLVTLNGCTALHKAIKHIDVATLLISYKINLDASDNKGLTALHYASVRGYHDIATLLIEHQCNVDATDINGCTALFMALTTGHMDLALLLSKHTRDVNIATCLGWTPLHEACDKGFTEVVQLLLQRESSVDNITENGTTALHLASECGHADIVEILIKHKSNINAVDEDGWTSLHLASQGNGADVINVLIKNKIDIEARTNEGRTALHYAAETGQDDIVSTLIQNKCDVNATDNKAFTPLHCAAKLGYVSVVTILLKQPQIDAGIQSVVGGTALSSALECTLAPFRYSDYVLEMLNVLIQQPRMDVNNPQWNLAEAVEISCLDVVELLLKNGANPNSVSYRDAEPAIFLAIRMKSVGKCSLLLAYKARLDVIYDGLTALQYAVLCGTTPEIIQLLLDHTNRSVDVVSLLQLCAVEGRREPLMCLAARVGVKEFVEKIFNEYSLEKCDFTGVNAWQLLCKYPHIRDPLKEIYTGPNAAEKNEDFHEYFEYTKKMSACISPWVENGTEIMKCSELYHQALLFKNQAQEIEDINRQAINLLEDVSETFQEKFLKFEPHIRGSVGEGTKVDLPNELDIVCFLKEFSLVDFEESELSSTHRLLKARKDFPLMHLCNSDGYVITSELSKAFYSLFISCLKSMLSTVYKGQCGSLFLPKAFFDKHDKISCITLIWRGNYFKDLVVKIDVVAAISMPNFQPDKRIPLCENTNYYLITKATGYIGYSTDIPISYSDCERETITRLPSNIRDGYILAKICRSPIACRPKGLLPITEPIHVDDYLTSYRLKVTLLFILEQFENDAKIHTDTQTKEQWAKNIYTKLIEFLENGYIPSFYERINEDCRLFSCGHDIAREVENRTNCCQQRHLMLCLCRQIVSFLDCAIQEGDI